MASCALCGDQVKWPASICSRCGKGMGRKDDPKPDEEGDDHGHDSEV